MQFNKIRVSVKHTIMNITTAVIFEHEVPIFQARFGHDNVEQLPDDERCGPASIDKITGERDEHNVPIVKKIPLERTLEQEWNRLMARPAMIQISETDAKAAPLVAFPRGALDLEDFYERLQSKKSNVVPITPPVQEETVKRPQAITPDMVDDEDPKDVETPLTERQQMKVDLDNMGIEYKGNASNASLRELLSEVTDVSTTVQN